MTEPAVVTTASKAPRRSPLPWEQQPGENALWYARFLRFVALGPRRSVSLVSTGQRNHYPVPAHWPMVAKQRSWRERATAFDEAVRKDEALMSTFESLFVAARMAAPSEEADKMMGIKYQPPPPDEAGDEQADSSTR